MTTQILFLKKAPSVRVVFRYAISRNSEVVIYPCVFRDGKEKEQKTKDKARMDEVNSYSICSFREMLCPEVKLWVR